MPPAAETRFFKRYPRLNYEAKKALVNELRHHRMDGLEFNVQSNAEYRLFYVSVMHDIARDYPVLSEEVERQVSKKISRQDRRSDEHAQSASSV